VRQPAEQADEVSRALLIAVAVVALLGIGAVIASPDTTPTAATVTQLKAKIRMQANRIADQNDELDAKDATISRLRARDPLDEVLAGSPDDLWAAMRTIWLAFPRLQDGAFCGYSKDYNPGDGLGLVATTYTFYRWTGC
jgi:hypothetical protein